MLHFKQYSSLAVAVASLILIIGDNGGRNILAAAADGGGVVGVYTATANSWCNDNGKFSSTEGETNTITLLPMADGSTSPQWIKNMILKGNFIEDEQCTRDDFSDGNDYDCITMSRNDMTKPNVGLRYSFNDDFTKMDKMVKIFPGASVRNDGKEQGPTICKIHAVKEGTKSSSSSIYSGARVWIVGILFFAQWFN